MALGLASIIFLGEMSASGEDLPPDLASVSGAEIPVLSGVPVTGLRAWADHGNGLEPVALQVDERLGTSADAPYAYEGGEDPHPDPVAGLDTNDLIILDASAAGDRSAHRDGMTEIEVQSPGEQSRWLYLSAGDSAQPSTALAYDARDDRVRGDGYVLGFAPHGHAWLDHLELGGDSRNLLDRSKVRLSIELAMGLSRIQRTEEDAVARTTGWHLGPLRLTREIEVRGRVLWNVYSRPMRDRFLFYRSGFSIPTSVRLSRAASVLVRRVDIRLTMDLRPAAEGLWFSAVPGVPPHVVTGHTGSIAAPPALECYLLRSGDVGLLGWLDAEGYGTTVGLYYADDTAHADPPEDVMGEIGHHGFLFRHEGGLAPGLIHVTSQAWVVRGAAFDDPAAARRRLEGHTVAIVHQ